MSQPRRLDAAAPRLKANVDTFRHVYRGQVWYVFHDRARDAYYRMSAGGAELVGAMDGRRSLGEIHQDLAARERGEPVDQKEMMQFASRLSGLGLLQTGLLPAAEAIESVQTATSRRTFWSQIKNPLAIRLPLFDPSSMLDRLRGLGAFLLGPVGVVLWVLVVGIGAVLGAMSWNELTSNLIDRMLSLENLAVAWLVYPAIKVVHEFAHAVLLRHYGGEVRRMGIIVVAFIPIPYVDASASGTFANKRWRMTVAAAGIMTELFLCGVALMLWTAAEPGLFRSVCYNVIMITGVSTMLFNGNPLQRYDGYYIYSDLIEIPDLGTRSTQYMLYLAKRYLLADTAAAAPRASRAEVRWFRFYGPASLLFRAFLIVSIIFYVATEYPVLGVVLAVWAIVGVLWTPLSTLFRVARHPDGAYRRRAGTRLALVALVLGLILFVLPAPHRAVVQGYFWLPDEGNARALAPGELASLNVTAGQMVGAGDPVAHLTNGAVTQRVVKAKAKLAELDATFTQYFSGDRVQAAIVQDRIAQARQELAEAEREERNLVVRSPVAGKVVIPSLTDIDGKFFTRGQPVAVIWNGDRVIVRTLVPLWQIDLIRGLTRSVDVKPTYDLASTLPAGILRIVPSATDRLASPVLSIDGGGPFATTRDAEGGMRLSEAMFQVDVAVEGGISQDFLNGRAYVRFDLGWEPIGLQIYRKTRLVFLRYFHA